MLLIHITLLLTWRSPRTGHIQSTCRARTCCGMCSRRPWWPRRTCRTCWGWPRCNKICRKASPWTRHYPSWAWSRTRSTGDSPRARSGSVRCRSASWHLLEIKSGHKTSWSTEYRPTSPLNLYPASEAGWQMLGEEAVVAEEAPVLVVVLGVHQGGVTLTAHETFVMPVAFSVIDQVLDMNWKFAPLADLCNRFSLKIIAPKRHVKLIVRLTF